MDTHREAGRMTLARTKAVIAGIAVLVALLGTAAAVAGRGEAPAHAIAMSPECRQAFDAYAAATDPAESDFWADSWMTFGCEAGGGYWA